MNASESAEHDREGRPLAVDDAAADYRRLFDTAGAALVVAAADGRIVEANAAAGALFGYSHAELAGQEVIAFIHLDHHESFLRSLQVAHDAGSVEMQCSAVRKDGTPIHVEVRATGVLFKGCCRALIDLRDVTESVQAFELLERRIGERTRELSTLLEVASQVASMLELRPLLGLILDQLKMVIAHSGSSIYVVEGEWLHMLEHRFPPDNGPIPEWLRIPLASSLFWPTVRHGVPFVIDDLHGDSPDAVAYRALWGERWEGIRPYARSYIAVPLLLKDHVGGALIISHSEPAYFTAERRALAMALASHAAVAIENARLYEQARDVAVLEERQRLSRELHDSVSQALYSIALGAQTARALLDPQADRAVTALDFVLTQAETALVEMRALIFELRPEALEQEGLAAALQRQVEAIRVRHHITVEATLCDEPTIPLAAKEAFYRIAQEAIHNTIKHAGASAVHVSLSYREHDLILRIQDDGQGFDPAASFPGHLGLHSMRERMTRIGGTLRVESAAGAGTTVSAVLPAAPKESA